MFQILKIDPPDVAKVKLTASDLMDTERADPKLTGRCYAYACDALASEYKQMGTTCHLWLLQHAIAALWEEHSRQKIFVCYEALSSAMRLFICSMRSVSLGKIQPILSQPSAYIETGQDYIPFSRIRPLVYWEPPTSMMALWPTGMNGETDGERVIDSGRLISWHSYPESDHAHSISVDDAGPDYTRVPTDEHGSFTLNDRLYRYVNRWGVVA